MEFECYEITPWLAGEIMRDGNYLVTSKAVYQVMYSRNAGFYTLKLASLDIDLNGFMILPAYEVNGLVGFNMVR